MWKNFDKHSAIYHTQSKIENFQFSVTLRTISSLLKVPKFEKTSISEDEDNSVDDSDHIENVKIHWQKKILSRYEIEFYKDIENCTTDVQKGYHNWIQRERLADKGQRSELNIFTYVQDDNYTPKEDLQQQQQHHPTSVKLRKTKNSLEFDAEPEVMYVFADLNPDTMLFTVKWWSSKGILLVYPDFNNYEKNPYFIEIDSDYRHLYSYAVQNISKTVPVDILENLQLPKVLKFFDKNLHCSFDMPPKNCTRASILFEIQEGCGFDYDSIHIRYKFQLPDRVQLEDGNLVGSTHSSKSLNGAWRFGYCFQITVICGEDFNFQDSIKVSFEIISRDSWERERNEGFCFQQISINANKMNQDVLPCYRMDYGFLEKIERFFIGGRRKFKFDEFNSGCEGFLNRYGSKVISTGLLKVGFSVLIQKSPVLPLKSKDRVRRSGMTLTDIMRAYQVARRRLEATFIK